MPCLSVHSPLGPLTLHEEDGSLTSLDWRWTKPKDGVIAWNLLEELLPQFRAVSDCLAGL